MSKLIETGSKHIKVQHNDLADPSFSDNHGSFLHDWETPPLLNVMIIAVDENANLGSLVHCRMGLGRIYLKR